MPPFSTLKRRTWTASSASRWATGQPRPRRRPSPLNRPCQKQIAATIRCCASGFPAGSQKNRPGLPGFRVRRSQPQGSLESGPSCNSIPKRAIGKSTRRPGPVCWPSPTLVPVYLGLDRQTPSEGDLATIRFIERRPQPGPRDRGDRPGEGTDPAGAVRRDRRPRLLTSPPKAQSVRRLPVLRAGSAEGVVCEGARLPLLVPPPAHR